MRRGLVGVLVDFGFVAPPLMVVVVAVVGVCCDCRTERISLSAPRGRRME